MLLLRVLLGDGGSDQMRRDRFVKGMGAAAGAALIDPFVLLSQPGRELERELVAVAPGSRHAAEFSEFLRARTA